MATNGSSMMYPQAVTILECFETELPILDRVVGRPYQTTKASGTTTKEAIPPHVLRYIRTKQFEDIASAVLELPLLKHRFTKKQIFTSMSELTQGNEAEVVPTSNAQWKMHQEHSTYGTEPFIVEDDGNGSSTSGRKSNIFRFDLRFAKTSSSINGTDACIAILEYKRRNYIEYTDFAPALLEDMSTVETVKAKKAAVGASKTHLKRDALQYTKHLAAYAHQPKCRHVALFNWDYLLLFDFFKISEQQSFPDYGVSITAGDEAKVAWVQERLPGKQYMEVGKIRKVMLGWIIQAFEEAGLVPESV